LGINNEQRALLASLRNRQARGEELSIEELRTAFDLLREDRRNAFHASEGAKRKIAKTKVLTKGEIVAKLREGGVL
jgi:hypothetical protein